MGYNDTRHPLKGTTMNTDFIKSVAALVASAGIGAVVTNAIKATTPEDIKIYNKIAVVIGTVVASQAISDVASTYASKQIDEVAANFKKAKSVFPSKKK